MVVHKCKVYVSTIDEARRTTTPLLYSSQDPEFYPWESLINVNAPGFDPAKNPTNPISNMAVFNNRIYVALSSANGAQVWRTNGPEPKQNDWTLIVDKGFGDPANVYTLGIGAFKDYLYVSGTKELPLSWLIPRGCDIIRINKNDNWRLIVGGNPFFAVNESERKVNKGASGLGSGFNNPFNVYAWQMQEYKGKLLISTFDDSSNMEVILDTLLANRLALEQLIGPLVTNTLIEIYKGVVEILKAIGYPIGFDLYMSEDGVHFSSITLRGLDNPNNYGGRILYVDSNEQLYLGTANPFQGCEVWKATDGAYEAKPCYEDHNKRLWAIRKTINEQFDTIRKNMPAVLQFIPKEYYHKFFD